MKKLAAILLLLLLLFNLFGYRLLFYYAQQQSDIQLRVSLDKDTYSEADLITLKVPLSLPYITDQKDFERADGEINLNGKIYKYVKRKVCEGQLVLLCLPDHHKMQLEKAKSDFFKNATDIAQNNGAKKSGKSKAVGDSKILSEYVQLNAPHITTAFITVSNHYMANHFDNVIAAPRTTPEQPPESI